MHSSVLITDVSPRDGLQNEPELLPIAAKVELVERLLAAGVARVELGSFVNPKQVPQMAGTREVARELAARGHDLGTAEPLTGGSRFTALTPNMRGFELAAEAGVRHVRLVLAASEGLNQANFKRSVADSLADLSAVAGRARASGVGFGVAIGASFGCPFDGRIPPERVLAIARELAALGADEVVLADTTGMAVPTQVAALCALARDALAGGPALAIHLHNTRNTGYANAYAAWQAGVRSFDAALGGIGGCPFAPRAVGNIATEDLTHMLNGMGVASGLDLTALIDSAQWLSAALGKPLPALVGKAEPVYR